MTANSSVICNKIQANGIFRKYRIFEKGCAKSIREVAMFLADHVYTSIANIYYHVNCFSKYIQRFKTANASSVPMKKEKTGKRFVFENCIKFIDEIISCGNGITPSEIRDMMNTNGDIDIRITKSKSFLKNSF